MTTEEKAKEIIEDIRFEDGTRRIRTKMKLAVTYENGNIFQHFGHTEMFKVYEVEDGKIVREELLETNGSGHGALAEWGVCSNYIFSVRRWCYVAFLQ